VNEDVVQRRGPLAAGLLEHRSVEQPGRREREQRGPDEVGQPGPALVLAEHVR
jgi:hypothetical protein